MRVRARFICLQGFFWVRNLGFFIGAFTVVGIVCGGPYGTTGVWREGPLGDQTHCPSLPTNSTTDIEVDEAWAMQRLVLDRLRRRLAAQAVPPRFCSN